MNFLFPGFLFALSAIAVPIIIHLFNFRKLKKVYFSNVAFLTEIEQKSSSRRQLRDLLILAARILSIVFLVFAFAKPYISSSLNTAPQQQVVSVYVDNSYSMETVNKEGTLLDEAKRRAKEIAAAYSLNDKFQIITNDFEGRHQQLLSFDDFGRAVDEINSSSGTRKIAEIIKRQESILKDEAASRKSLYLVSDFQKNMLSNKDVPADSGISINLVRLKSNPLPNISIDSVWFTSPVHRPGETEKINILLKNDSDQSASNVPVRFSINNKQKAFGSISIEARKTNRLSLSFNGLQAGLQEGLIHITDNPITFDDDFYFSFYVKSGLNVLAVNEEGFNPYLKAVYAADPFFRLQNTSSGNINYSSLQEYPLIILNELKLIPAGLAQQLQSYVKGGGTLMVFPSFQLDMNSYQSFLNSLAVDIPETIITGETKVESINFNHPVFHDVFEQVPKNIDLPVAKKYILYSSRSRTNKIPLLSFPGRKSFLSQYAFGKGKIYLSAVPLSEDASNFVRHAVFVPIMYQVALSGLQNPKLFYTIGADEFLDQNKLVLSANQTVKLQAKDFETIPDIIHTGDRTRLYIADQIKKPGIYRLLKGDSVLNAFAFNLNRSESDLSYATDKLLKKELSGNPLTIIDTGAGSVQNEIKARQRGVELWKLCLILALFCLLAEILLVRFYRVNKTIDVSDTHSSGRHS